jgi:hypothetical protein
MTNLVEGISPFIHPNIQPKTTMKQERGTNNMPIFLTNFKRNARQAFVYQENFITIARE